ncbi:pantoate--beta-alanine ligase [Candidatus Auribacterota bacterium]
MMKIIREKNKLRKTVLDLKRRGKKIAFVPTMGALHKGHIALIERARKAGDVLVLSIFVNPLQFGPNEDFNSYPGRLRDDTAIARGKGVDIVFIPSVEELYGSSYSTIINEVDLSAGLCGACRPGHFSGVATIVGKLFNIVMPDVAVFGQKDYQQYKVIERMVEDLDLPVRLIMVKTVLDKDGLALSSRNKYLTRADRKKALSIRKALSEAASEVSGGRDNNGVARRIKEKLNRSGIRKIDYVSVLNKDTLQKPAKKDKGILVAAAVRIGKTRLIDNVIVNK